MQRKVWVILVGLIASIGIGYVVWTRADTRVVKPSNRFAKRAPLCGEPDEPQARLRAIETACEAVQETLRQNETHFPDHDDAYQVVALGARRWRVAGNVVTFNNLREPVRWYWTVTYTNRDGRFDLESIEWE